jgi:hypothetical protein
MKAGHMKSRDMTTKLLSRQLDRRAFLGGAGFTAGAVVACSLVPLSLVHALPSEQPVGLTPAADSWTGHVDDACGHWPPYSHPISFGVGRSPDVTVTAATLHAAVEPIDYILMV